MAVGAELQGHCFWIAPLASDSSQNWNNTNIAASWTQSMASGMPPLLTFRDNSCAAAPFAFNTVMEVVGTGPNDYDAFDIRWNAVNTPDYYAVRAGAVGVRWLRLTTRSCCDTRRTT